MTLRHALPLIAASLAALPLFVRAAVAEPPPQVGSPITHENIAVYFLRGASASGPIPDTLQEALAKGSVIVHETGEVQELKIENRGDRPVFVQFGDIVKGGQQDRVLTISMVLEPKSGLVPVGAYCVEQGRWAARGKEDVRRFAEAAELMPSREAKIAMAKPYTAKPADPAANPPVRQGFVAGGINPPPLPRQQRLEELERFVQQRGPRGGDSQGEVWRSVGLVQQQLAGALDAPVASDKSRTSLQLSLENERLQTARAGYLAAIEPAGLAGDDIVGVVFAVNGRVASADVYPSNGLFRKMWPKLARAAATEALAKTKDTVEAAPSPQTVAELLAAAAGGEKSEREIAGRTRIEARSTPKSVQVETRSLTGQMVHRNYIAY